MQEWKVLVGGSTNTINLETTTQTATKTHNGVNWKYTNNGVGTGVAPGVKADKATSNAITIEGKVKIYKAMSGTTGYQTYINKDPNAATAREEQTVTVTIILVPASPASAASARRSTK